MILKNSKFKYSKAREMILDAILAGNLAQDAILPSEQILQKQLKIGRNTLRSALRELEETGIIGWKLQLIPFLSHFLKAI